MSRPLAARTVCRVDEKSVAITEDYFITVKAYVGHEGPDKVLVQREHTLKIPVWDLRFLVKGAVRAWRERAAQAERQAASFAEAAK